LRIVVVRVVRSVAGAAGSGGGWFANETVGGDEVSARLRDFVFGAENRIATTRVQKFCFSFFFFACDVKVSNTPASGETASVGRPSARFA
jgi:hypothetical protein